MYLIQEQPNFVITFESTHGYYYMSGMGGMGAPGGGRPVTGQRMMTGQRLTTAAQREINLSGVGLNT